jgi:hypothetical protein
MVSIGLFFLIAAAVCFFLASVGIPTGRVNTTALGLLCLTIWFIVPALGRG